ncbi:MAG: hypothetical protein ACRERC_04555 [Candidatus Binatia bacterium]
MTLTAKRRLVIAFLALFAVWPLVHRGLVARYHMTPWRLFGWAMYCTPKLPVRAEVYALRGGARERLNPNSIERRHLREAVFAFARRRGVWGEFEPPDRLARFVLRSEPGLDAVEIELEEQYLDPATSHIGARRSTHRFER